MLFFWNNSDIEALHCFLILFRYVLKRYTPSDILHHIGHLQVVSLSGAICCRLFFFAFLTPILIEMISATSPIWTGASSYPLFCSWGLGLGCPKEAGRSWRRGGGSEGIFKWSYNPGWTVSPDRQGDRRSAGLLCWLNGDATKVSQGILVFIDQSVPY